MENTLSSRVKRVWNAFTNRDPTIEHRYLESGYSYRPDRTKFSRGNEKSIVTSVYNKIAISVAGIDIKHCRLDKEGRYLEDIDSGLNTCLNLEANIDQTGRAFRQDIVMSMLDEGVVAIVPVDTDRNPTDTSSFEILSMRTGKVIEWKPTTVKVRVYNERTGRKEDVVLPKRMVAIVENPFYSVFNEPNSTMQRLIRKLNILDAIDEQSGSGKLDIIVQLPYSVKGESKRAIAEKRRSDIEEQLKGPYGIAYIDGVERITQLNRPVENNLMKQIEYLTSMLYSQLGINQSIMDGTADEKTQLNFFNNTIEPIVIAIAEEMKRKFLTKTARSQGQSIECFKDPFKLLTAKELAEIADVLCRNEIASSNEMRQKMGWKPSDDPRADQLRNSNMYGPEDPQYVSEEISEEGGEVQNGTPAYE